MNMHEVAVILKGKVQGVGMRAFVKRVADEMGIVGRVENAGEDRVEVIAQGEEEELRQFVEAIKKGTYFSRIDEVEVEWSTTLQDAFTEFSIE